jgi:hypothetical protein
MPVLGLSDDSCLESLPGLPLIGRCADFVAGLPDAGVVGRSFPVSGRLLEKVEGLPADDCRRVRGAGDCLPFP